MGIKGKVREQSSNFSKETGLFEGKVVAVNPDKVKLAELLNTEIEKDPEYSTTDANGVKKASVVFWLKDVKTNKVKDLRFFLTDRERENKDKTKKQYITDMGDTSWTDNQDNLPEWFKKRSFRVAKEGEEQLYKFLGVWLSKMNKKDPEASMEADFKALINGNASELAKLIKSELVDTVVVLKTIRIVDSNGETKEYEQIYNQEFLPGYIMKYVRAAKIDDTFIEVAKSQSTDKRTKLQKFVLTVKDPQYGVKDYFTLGELEIYDPSKNIASTDKVISDEDASY